MKTPPASLRLGLAATAALLAAATASAQSVVTDPVGFTTLTVAAKPASTRGFTYLSLNMFRPTAFRSVVPTGGVSAAGSNTTLTFPANSFTAGQFSGVPHFLEIRNGTSAGVLVDISSNTTNTVTLSEDVSALITAGTTTISVRPHWTFGTAFLNGTASNANGAGFTASNTATNADTVQLLNPATGTFVTYFYSSVNNRWQNGGADATNVVIRPDSAMQIERKTTTALSFTLVGEVKLGPTEVPVNGGAAQSFTLAPNPYPLNSVTLANSGLYTGNASTGVVGSNTATNADTVGVLNPATGLTTVYFYSTVNNRWQNGGTDASNVVINEGTGVLITRRAGRPTFSWFVPQPTMNL